MNKSELRKLARKVCLQISSADLDYFGRSFSAVLPMITKLLSEEVEGKVDAMERIITTPLEIPELSRIQRQSSTSILSREQIEKNSSLKASKIITGRKYH